MTPPLNLYALEDAGSIVTPALLIYPEVVETNITATLRMVDNDPNRWRPHIKTAKIPAVLRHMIARGVQNFKCSTTLELLTACEAGANDVLVAFPMMGANARRAAQIAEQFPSTRVSVLVETSDQGKSWQGTPVQIFIDINPGMNRTGISLENSDAIVELAASLGERFRGLHSYDGHASGFEAAERQTRTQVGYDKLMELIGRFQSQGVRVGEVITSGTPAAPHAGSYQGFRQADFIHRISPGTVVYNDMTSLQQLPDLGYAAAALVLATVVSHPTDHTITCDAGHKSVSVDAGVPNCAVLGWPNLQPAKPSEEHLPIDSVEGVSLPKLGSKLYLLPRHVCPTVNNFDEALMVVGGKVQKGERVSARGHESLFAVAG